MQCANPECDRPAVVLDSNNLGACAPCAIASMVKRDPTIQTTPRPTEGDHMSNVICSLCRGDHTYEEHMQTERDMLDMSVSRHPAGKNSQGDNHTPHCASNMEALSIGCTCLNGEDAPPSSVLDHAWRTIPRDVVRGVARAVDTPAAVPPVGRVRSLLTPANIVTVTVTAAALAMFAAVILAWFFDWKMP